MDDTVGDLLNLRGVRLTQATKIVDTVGFRCLGVAEKIPELDEESGSFVHVWHIPKAILPVSVAEAERWLVDAPSGAHWILSEREFDEQASELLSSKLKIELWSPDILSRWIGEAVLRGDLHAKIPQTEIPEIQIEENIAIEDPNKLVILPPIVDLDEWCIQRGIEHVDAKPILLQARIWNITGALVSPEGDREEGNWSVLEDPWANRLESYDSDKTLKNSPNLRTIKALENKWLNDVDLRVMLIGILEARRQKEEDATEGSSVRSTMLERWSFDSERAILEEIPSAIPGWLLDHEGGIELLHSRNGRTYEINSSEVP
ncbi:MAG: hypothetical protein VYB30_01980 [Candidatus Thermoplasmatota archaeon]|nr:hypothetical protein [Candidatus Thermoplasmatota archaeon]